MKIKFAVSFPMENDSAYIKIGVEKNEKEKTKVNNTILNITNKIYLKFYPVIDPAKSSVSIPENEWYTICFYSGMNYQYIQVIQEMVDVLISKVHQNTNSVVYSFLDKCGFDNFELYSAFLKSLELYKPDMHTSYLVHLRKEHLNLLDKLINEENNPDKRLAYIDKSLSSKNRMIVILGYIRHFESEYNSVVPNVLQAITMNYMGVPNEVSIHHRFFQSEASTNENRDQITNNVSHQKTSSFSNCVVL